MQQVLSQGLDMFTGSLLPRGNGVPLVSGDTSGAPQTAPLSQCLEGVDHLLLGSAQIEERGVSVLGERFPAGIALEELSVLFAIAPVANNVSFASHSIVGTLLIGAKELTGIHGRHLLHQFPAMIPHFSS